LQKEEKLNTPEAAFAMVALFLLRLAFPLIATVVFGYGMNRLVDHFFADVEP